MWTARYLISTRCSTFTLLSSVHCCYQVFNGLLNHVNFALEAGFVPVVHGDAVIDSSRGCSILSGDTLMVALSKAFQPRYCVFVTNVDGVYDRDPVSVVNNGESHFLPDSCG